MLSDLLRETDDVEAKRKACLEMRELLRRALDIVNEVRAASCTTTTITGASAVRASLSFNSHLGEGAHGGHSNNGNGHAHGAGGHAKKDDDYG